jgi:hypothetical protein
MELPYYSVSLHLGGDSSKHSGAGGFKRCDLSTELPAQNISILPRQITTIPVYALHPGICTRLGNTPAPDGQEDIEGIRYVAYLTVNLIL